MLLHAASGAAWGGGYNVTLAESGADVAYLNNTDGDYDTVSGGPGATIYLDHAQADITGGSEKINLDGSNVDFAALLSTGSAYDTVTGSNGKISLTKATAEVIGSDDAVFLDGPSGNELGINGTNGAADKIYGSNGDINLGNNQAAQASIYGGNNSVYLENGDTLSLFNTGSAGDTVNGGDSVINLTNAQAHLGGSHDTVNFTGANSLSAVGDTDTFAFQAAIGVSTIAGFNSSDFIELAQTDFASWSVLKGHLSEVSGNAVITLDANDKITLTGVALSSLTKADFEFV
jgi:hypothetical protein